LKLKAIAKTKKQKGRESFLQSEQHPFLRRWLQARLEVAAFKLRPAQISFVMQTEGPFLPRPDFEPQV
jgi:hypothetical protein